MSPIHPYTPQSYLARRDVRGLADDVATEHARRWREWQRNGAAAAQRSDDYARLFAIAMFVTTFAYTAFQVMVSR
jgi:hypothetical protein